MMVIFIENREMYSIAVTCWQGVFLLFCGCETADAEKVSACVFMMRPCGTISLQAVLINLGQHM